jgi:sortase family protein
MHRTKAAALILGAAAAIAAVVAADLLAGPRIPQRPQVVASSPAAPVPARLAAGPAGPAVSDIGASGARLIIPALGVNAAITPAGAIGAPGNAALAIPSDVATVGWWDGIFRAGAHTVQEKAPAPGQPGVALIAGHVDSAAVGPGALYKLGNLVPGDAITIIGSGGRSTRWTVSAMPDTALKTELPPALWVTTGPPELALVTCGGPFDTTTGHYLDNVIVWARQN